MSSILAVDFGGTNIRVAHFEHPIPPPTEQLKQSTLAQEGPDQVLQRLIDAIGELMPQEAAGVRIGIAAPGPLDPTEGVIYSPPNLSGWHDFPLRQQLIEAFDCPVALGNDANMAALGEWKHGAGIGTEHMIYITISTGIGGGIISHGHLLTGSHGLGAELGHMTVVSNGPRCGCGIHGHIEAVASGPAIAKRALERLQSDNESSLREYLDSGEPITTIEVAHAAKAGDLLAIQVITEAGQHLGHHLADLAHVFNPEMFVLGGGVSSIGPLLFNSILQSLKEHVMDPVYLKDLRVVPAALGDDAGLVGAMVLANQG